MLTMILALALPAHAEELSKSACKAFSTEAQAALSGTVWALKDLPVKTGFTMYAAWISPLSTLTPTSFTVDGLGGVAGTFGGASATWWGVRPYDTLRFEEVECNEDGVILDLVGVAGSKGKDTKIRLAGADTFAAFQTTLAQVLTTTDPAAEWPDAIRQAIANRVLVNGMTKRQAYLVVGEPIGATTKDEAGKSVEIWRPRQDGGVRIGYGATIQSTGYPLEIRFEDGKLTGLGNAGGGVSLD